MKNSIVSIVTILVTTVTAFPDGPGGHHHHHGDHHGEHPHQQPHHTETVATVNLGSSHHVQSLSPSSGGHIVHSVQPVHSSFSIQPESVVSTHQNIVSSPVVVKSSPKTIADLLSTNPKFSTLQTAVKAAGLGDTLASSGPMTVFAPTNTAFDKVPVDKLNGLLADKEALKNVLLRHVVPGTNMQGKNIPPGTTTLKTAAGVDITATRDKFIQLNSSAGSAYVVLFDVLGSNGVVHAVDTVF